MPNFLAVLLALVLATGIASALEPPVPDRFLGAGDGRAVTAVCGARVAAVLEGVAFGGTWTMTLHALRGGAAEPNCTFVEKRTFHGALDLAAGGCIPATNGPRDWLCLAEVSGRLDLGVHWDVCYRLDPCALEMHGELQVLAP